MPWLKPITGIFFCQLSRLLMPRRVKRDKASQAQVDRDASNITFYDVQASIECCLIRRLIHKLNIAVQIRDVGRHYQYRIEVLEGGQGRLPCLKIESPRENPQWLYGRCEIQQYLQQRFSPDASALSAQPLSE